MLGIVNYGAFVASTVALCLTPGIDTVYILPRSLAGGRREGVASALGINAIPHVLVAPVGKKPQAIQGFDSAEDFASQLAACLK